MSLFLPMVKWAGSKKQSLVRINFSSRTGQQMSTKCRPGKKENLFSSGCLCTDREILRWNFSPVAHCALLFARCSLLFTRCSTRNSERFFSKSKQKVLHINLYKKINLKTRIVLNWRLSKSCSGKVSLKTSCSGKSVKYRSRRSQMFFKIAVLKKFVIFTGKHLCWSLFLIQQQY